MPDTLKSREELLSELSHCRQQRDKNLNEIRLNSLINLSQMQDKSYQQVLDFGLEEALRLTESRIGYIYFYNEETELFTLYSWSASVMPLCAVMEKQRIYQLKETGLWGEAVRQRQAIITNDYAAPNPHKKGYPEGHVSLRNHLNLPIFVGQNIVAVIGVGNKESNYNAEDVLQLQLFMEGLWNIAERKRIEEELKKSDEKFRTIADFTFDWEYWINPGKIILYCSPSCQRLTGYTPEEFLDNPNLLPQIVHPEDGPTYEKHTRDLQDPLQNDRDGEELEFRIITKSGESKWIGHVCRQVFTSDGVYAGRRVSNRDITDRKDSEMKLIQSSEEINRLNGNILNMLKILSHDIRSPLISISSTLRLLQRGSFGLMDESVTNTVADLAVRVNKLLGIADDSLGKAHSVDAQMKIEKLDIDLRHEVIETVLEEISDEITSKKITIDNRLGAIPTGAIVINASKIWLKAVYRNLFKNAIKYGGDGCTIAFGYEDRGGFYQLSVFNTGIPIPIEKRNTLFTRFGRVWGETEPEGIGMGLFLIKEIILQHGGDIWYQEVDGGNAFIFTLPK